MRISVIVLGYNHKDITIECLNSVVNSHYPDYEVIYVDNNSDFDVNREIGLRFPLVKIVRLAKNYLFAKGMNEGIKRANGKILFLLGNDTTISNKCLKEIDLYMRDKSIGCANAKMLNSGASWKRLNTSINRSGFMNIFPHTEHFGEIDIGQCDDLIGDYACGGAMVLRTSVLDDVGIFDEQFPYFWQDMDLSFRIKKAGYKIGFIPKALVWHRGGYTSKQMPWRAKWDMNKGRLRMLLKWGGRK